MLPGKEMSCSRPQCSSPNGGDTSRIAMSLIYYKPSLACWQCDWRTEAPSNGLRRREQTTTRQKKEGQKTGSHVDFLNLIVYFVMANFLLSSTCLLCDVYDDLGRWRGCIQCGQSIVCLRLFRGHTCVCPSCWMPE